MTEHITKDVFSQITSLFIQNTCSFFVGRHPFHPLKLHYRSESIHTEYNLTMPPTVDTVATDAQTLTALFVS